LALGPYAETQQNPRLCNADEGRVFQFGAELESGNARDAGAAYEFLLTGCCILDGSIVDLFGVGMGWT
jgi:hypothetical protein